MNKYEVVSKLSAETLGYASTIEEAHEVGNDSQPPDKGYYIPYAILLLETGEEVGGRDSYSFTGYGV